MKNRVFIGLLCLVSIFLLSGCLIVRRSLTAEEFSSIAERNNLNVVDVYEQFSEYNQITTANVAVSDDEWQVEHYTLKTKSDAQSMFHKNMELFEAEKTTGSKDSKIEIGNFIKYTLQTDSLYMVVSRIDNTLLYAKVPIEYKDAVNKVIKDLGY